MNWMGAHTSAAGGLQNALYEGRDIDATTIQLFTSNQRQWQGRMIGTEEIALWEKALEETGIRHVMSHASYLLNLGSGDLGILHKSRQAFREELIRCHALKISYLNVHPGAATVSSEEETLRTIATSLLELEHLAANGETRILLEMTAGQGRSVGHRFEQIAFILQEVRDRIPIGVCIDTCHLFVAGYDIRTEEGWRKTLKEFDEMIGLKYLYALHLNDSVKDCGSRVDRHAPLGAGMIGWDFFHLLMRDEEFHHLPKYLETPGGPPLWKEELTQLRELIERPF